MVPARDKRKHRVFRISSNFEHFPKIIQKNIILIVLCSKTVSDERFSLTFMIL